MADIEAARTALVIYDMTATLLEGPGTEPWIVEAIGDLVRLLDRCRQAGVFVCYANSAAGYAGFDIPAQIAPLDTETRLLHTESGAFSGTSLEEILRNKGIDTVIVAGMAVDRGANTTARQAMNRRFRAVMAQGACYTHDISESPFGPIGKHEIERVHLAALYRMGAAILGIDELIQQLS